MSERELLRSDAGVELWEVRLRMNGSVVASSYVGKTPRTPQEFTDARRPQADAWFDQEVDRVLGRADPQGPRWP